MSLKCPLCGSTQKKEQLVQKIEAKLEKHADKAQNNREKVKELKQKAPKPVTIRNATGVTISHHAIDRMSTRHYDTYLKYREHNEQGIVTWMRNVAQSIFASGQLKKLEEKVKESGVTWVFERKKKTYVLVTVTPKR